MANPDILIIGGGPAGLAAAISAKQNYSGNVIMIERDDEPGGILQQCIHNGFGLQIFKEELTGPEYAQRFIDAAREAGVKVLTGTTVLDISEDREVTVVNPADGLHTIKAGAVVLGMGCRERSRGALNIPGSRPAGIFTAGAAQRFVNIDGYLPGKKVVILGSGDIGLIMARRMVLEGASVETVCELLPYSSGLTRNIVQCLEDNNIPLELEHTVTAIHGAERLEGVTISRVDADRKPIPGTERHIDCDTLLLSVGLIPENELSKSAGVVIDPRTGGPVVDQTLETTVSGIFACGNVLHVHDLVDHVSNEAALAGRSAAKFASRTLTSEEPREKSLIDMTAGQGVRYIVPQKIDLNRETADMTLFFRPDGVYENVFVRLSDGEKELARKRNDIMTPGEMAFLIMDAKIIENLTQDSRLKLEIIPAGDNARTGV